MKLAPHHRKDRNQRECWKVDISAKESGTRRLREFFPSELEGKRFMARCVQIGITEAILERKRPTDIQPTATSNAPILSKCWGKFEAGKSSTGKSNQTQVKYVGKSLKSALGSQSIDLVSHRELSDWLKGIPGGEQNRYNHHRVAKRFFTYCHEWLEAIPRNPFAKLKMERPSSPIDILAPETMRSLLEKAVKLGDPRHIFYLALGGFAGLRTVEVLRCDWADFNWRTGELKVPNPKKTKRGIRPRWVKIHPVLRRLLEQLKKDSGRLVTLNASNFIKFRKRLSDEMKWEEWPDNCLRHSFATYHLAKFKNPPLTSHELGHEDPQTKYGHYVKDMAPSVAKKWWAL